MGISSKEVVVQYSGGQIGRLQMNNCYPPFAGGPRFLQKSSAAACGLTRAGVK
jgi:hypothetical protein